MGSSGIDESNAGNYYILLPKDPDKSAKNIWKFLRREYKVKNIGVIITDSNSAILKRGIVGKAISFYGFSHLKDYIGKKDLFGRKFKYSRTNIPDSVASFAVYLMGEGDEQTPIAIFENIPFINFLSRSSSFEKKYSSWKVPIKEDLFRPFLKSVKWKKGGNKI
jgi:F420-0:gamma-glutamyl ligase